MAEFREVLRSRFAVFAGVIVVVLSVLGIRLWQMQLLQGAQYSAKAESNKTRYVSIAAPRGRILDRNGTELVSNRPTLAVLVDPGVVDADEPETRRMIDRLAGLLAASRDSGAKSKKEMVRHINERLASVKEEALAPRLIDIDVPMETVAYLAEHSDEFPGVQVQSRSVRVYEQGRLAAHVLGYTGEISQEMLANKPQRGYELTDIVGKSGVELQYEEALQGVRGKKRLEVNASGDVNSEVIEARPKPGRDIRLTIDANVQKVTEKALQQARVDARKDGFPNAAAGAAVALSVDTGEVLALASFPDYDPKAFLGGISHAQWSALNSKDSLFPLTNRAVAGLYPPASTFKAFTGLAALESGFATPWSTYTCRGRWIGMGEEWHKYCWNRGGHGQETFTEGISDSCDVVFYEIGLALYRDRAHAEDIQKMARRFGYHEITGIDLPGEMQGRMPDAAWKADFNKNYPEYKQWLPGDTVNLSIGQGDALVTPLQVAYSYALIASGGKTPRPHLLRSVEGAGKAETSRAGVDPRVDEKHLDTIRGALRDVTTIGTAKSVFAGFEIDVAGKTGTAQVAGKDDYAWFVGYAPADEPKYCVAVLIEQGGHGGSIAGPVARQMIASLFGKKIEHVTARDESR